MSWAFSRRVGRALALGAALGLAQGCEPEGALNACSFGTEHVIAETVAKGYEALDVVELSQGLVALWSEPAGLFARTLASDGTPRGPIARLGPRCEGGMAAVATPDGLGVACLALDAETHESMTMLVYSVDAQLKPLRARAVGRAGPLSRGTTVAYADDGLHVAWHDGSTEAQQVRWLRVDGPGESRVLSGKGNVAGAPSSAVLDGRLHLVWAERWLVGEELESRVMLWAGEDTARDVLAVHHLGAMPQLVTHADRLVLAVRDYGGIGARAGLFVSYLDPDDRGVGKPSRVARADGVYRPSLSSCMDGIVAATPRTYGGDYFVGVAKLDDDLSRPHPEQQFYEDSHAFTRAAVSCVGSQAIVVIAEHGALDHDTTRLRAVPYRCR